jgi:hypothetical protein
MNKIVIIVLASISSLTLLAKENVGNTSTSNSQSSLARVAADCTPSQAKTDLNINNVRTTIMGAADMWWNLSDARYEIPKNSNKHSMFAGALWIAGIDAGEQLKAAAMTYRQTGNTISTLLSQDKKWTSLLRGLTITMLILTILFLYQF